MAAAAPRWSRLDHDERRELILGTARRLFCERHYAAVSTEEIARAAGVTRGLLHHYFGTKRDLYLEVVAGMVSPPADPVDPPGPGRPLEVVVDESVDRWLDMVDRYRETWLSVLGAEGFGRDPDLEELVAAARDETVDLVVSTLGLEGHPDDRELRAVLRAYSGLAEIASREWLQSGTLSRRQTHALLSAALLALVGDVVPAVVAAGSTG